MGRVNVLTWIVSIFCRLLLIPCSAKVNFLSAFLKIAVNLWQKDINEP